jgi:hypothetical protein
LVRANPTAALQKLVAWMYGKNEDDTKSEANPKILEISGIMPKSPPTSPESSTSVEDSTGCAAPEIVPNTSPNIPTSFEPVEHMDPETVESQVSSGTEDRPIPMKRNRRRRDINFSDTSSLSTFSIWGEGPSGLQ